MGVLGAFAELPSVNACRSERGLKIPGMMMPFQRYGMPSLCVMLKNIVIEWENAYTTT